MAKPQGLARSHDGDDQGAAGRHKYPPDKPAEATENVIARAELLADAWAGDATPRFLARAYE